MRSRPLFPKFPGIIDISVLAMGSPRRNRLRIDLNAGWETRYMAKWAAILLLLGTNFILGRLFLAHILRRKRRFDGDHLSLGFASLSLGFLLTGWLALVLAEIGWFSIGLLAGIWLAMVVVLLIALLWRRANQPLANGIEFQRNNRSLIKGLPHWIEYALLAIWLIVASWLFFRPHEYVLGAADAGVYVNLAANISRTGSIVINDPALAELAPELYPTFLRPLPETDFGSAAASYYILPGFYVTDAPVGRVIPQFYPLHPVWQAVAFDIGGVQASLLMTGLWALLSGMAIYLIVRRITSWEVGILALAALTINALQVWFARYPTTEALTQYLLWTAVWSMIVWIQDGQPRAVWGLLAGLALGEVFLVRIDTYFLMAIPVTLWFWRRWSGRWQSADWLFFASVGILFTHSLTHALLQSEPYFINIFGYGLQLMRRNWLIPVGIVMASLLVLVVLVRYGRDLQRLNSFRRPLLIAAVGVIVLLAAYGWLVRPNLGGPDVASADWYSGSEIPRTLDRENLIRLGWYLSPLGILLSIVGVCLMIWKVNRGTAIILATGLVFTFIYLWRIQANPHQIYAMRRYVPTVMPFAIVASAYLFDWLFKRKLTWIKIGSVGLAFLWIASLGWSARGFVSQVDHRGLIAQLDNLNETFEPNSILIFDDQAAITVGDIAGTPLHFIYGHDIFSLRDLASLDEQALLASIESWKDQGRTVYWIGQQPTTVSLDLATSNPLTLTIKSQHLEGTYERKPVRIIESEWQLEITPLQ